MSLGKSLRKGWDIGVLLLLVDHGKELRQHP
jgi:hypothetical protein